MIELDKIYNEDCLEGMKRIPTGSVDAIICDPPYGTMKGFGKSVAKIGGHKHDWDDIIPTDELFKQYARVLRRGGTAVLFSQEPYTSHLRTFKGTELLFLYPMIWVKDQAGNFLTAKKAPLNFFEDVSVFLRRKDNDNEKEHPLREYSERVARFMGKDHIRVQEDLKEWGITNPTRVSHFLNYDGVQFRLCTNETYNILIQKYGIDRMDGFKEWRELREKEALYDKNFEKVFNIPETENFMRNVLEFAKDTDGFHPTQKPLDLIRRLVLTYTNEGDTVLDNCMGSGSTAVACIKEKRHFIGFETDPEFYRKACKRIEDERAQLTLF